MKETIDKFKTMIKTLESEHGPFLIFALFLRESVVGKWDVVISAPWLDPNDIEAYKLISSKLQQTLSESEVLQFPRIVLLDPEDDVVTFLLDLETIKNGGYKEFSAGELSDKFKFTIKRAYLLRSARQP